MSARDTLKAHLVEDLDEKLVDDMLGRMDDEQVEVALAGVLEAEAEKVALKARLMNDPELRVVVTPHTDWGTPFDRFTVAKTAVAMLERAAKKNDLTFEDLVQAFTANGDSMWQEMTRYRDPKGNETVTDPRFDGFGPGHGFHAFSCRVRDAVETATEDRRKAAQAVRDAQNDARWANMGMVRCDRCGGAGGHEGWPGFTCYDCGGEGAVAAS